METHHQVGRWVLRLFMLMSRINARHSVCGGPTEQKGMALVGFQGRGATDGVQPDFCHTLLLEALLFH